MLKLGITISTSVDCGEMSDEMSTYWFGANVYVYMFPVVGSTTLKVRVSGYRFSRYTSPIFHSLKHMFEMNKSFLSSPWVAVQRFSLLNMNPNTTAPIAKGSTI